ncbi:MAG: hypothetical protein M3R54_01565, partial [Chloroflexota bacterium]|nr:hypothetical protein [Chloroflexota bacterium]
ARRMAPLATELGIPHVVVVANKLRDDEDRRVVRDYLQANSLELIAEIPFDDAVRDADRRGRPLLDASPDSQAARAITTLAGRLS